MERIKKRLKAEAPVTWLFYGDSITQGVRHCGGSKNYTEIFAERVRFECRRPLDIVINAAMAGNTSEHLLESFESRCGRFEPEVVLMMIGMNDCNPEINVSPERVEDNLHRLADKIAVWNGLAVFQTSCPILCPATPESAARFEVFMDLVRKVAAARKLPLIDHLAHWRTEPGRHFFLMSNQAHPNAFGHIVFAHYLFRELDIFDPEANMCRLFTVK